MVDGESAECVFSSRFDLEDYPVHKRVMSMCHCMRKIAVAQGPRVLLFQTVTAIAERVLHMPFDLTVQALAFFT